MSGGAAAAVARFALSVTRAMPKRDAEDEAVFLSPERLAARRFVAMSADCLGDDAGRAWDPAWSAAARAAALDDGRARQHARLRACAAALAARPDVDASRLAAVGFCFGGRAVVDAARGRVGGDALRAAVAFHGILDDHAPHGGDVAAALGGGGARAAGARWELHAYGGARHGFSNPAQALNANPAFGYDPAIAAASWATMKAVLADEFAE